ncbi:ATP-binding protein [Rubrolithibacter danxiaensis]|uniref:sensor histidine kinase n=1 Tax=Rubrolithibacter danxiaensis TaxID=3390805 RepID=UPI003BF777FC
MRRVGAILKAIFDSSDDVWFFVGPDYNVIFFNQKAFTNGKVLHGKELKEGDSILEYARDTKNNIDTTFISRFEKALNGEIVKEEQHIEYGSTSLWFQSKYIPVYEFETLIGVSITVSDITKEKNLEIEQAKAQEEIQKLLKRREQFLSIVSHELRTPITTLRASLQLLNKGLSNHPLESLLQKSNNSLGKLNNIIEDLLTITKVKDGHLTLNKSYITISDVVNDCCEHIRTSGNYKIITEGDLDLEVYADPLRIDQVLVNLINNAIKYAPKSFDVIVRIERVENTAKVSIIDKGPGIAEDNVAHLFQRYYQVESNGYQQSGLGLGLYISAEIIKRHEGKIGVESTLGIGSTFWFTLPLSDS